jgi:hypothetical protein
MGDDWLLEEDWSPAWVPFTVVVRPEADCLVLEATGHLDEWTAGAILRNLVAVCEPCYAEVHLDLSRVQGAEAAKEVIARCRTFAEGRRLRFRVSTPPTTWVGELPTALPGAAR